MSKFIKLCVATAGAVAMAGAASAAIDLPVPTTDYITFGGLDWAWAGPCAPFVAQGSCNDSGTDTMTAYQASQGWRIPTYAEFAARPTAADFGGACASPYFGSGYSHCDVGDAAAGYIWDYGYNLASGGTDPAAETWFVRGAGGVPEPAGWALMLLGVGGMGAALRGQRRKATAAV